MSSTDEHPYRGEAINGSSASISPGVPPQFLHIYRYESSLRFLIKSAIVLLVIGALAIFGGLSLRGVEGWAAGIGSYAAIGLGGLFVLLGLLIAFIAFGFWCLLAQAFKNGLLTPGVVVSQEPTTLAVLAEMGNGGPTYYGVRRLIVPSLPVHGEHLETRVPCSSTFQPGDAEDRWAWFSPTPICHGTARPSALNQCFQRLGDEPFRQLNALVRQSLIPPDESQLILLDENFQILDRLPKPN